MARNQTTAVGNQTIRLKIVTWLEIKPPRWKSNHPVGNQTTGVKSKQRYIFFFYKPPVVFCGFEWKQNKTGFDA